MLCLPSDTADDILEQLSASFHNQHDEKMLICRTSSCYVHESVEGLGIHFHKVDLNPGASYIPSLDWIKNKKATINRQNTKDTYCFMYAVTIALYHEEREPKLERISNKLLDRIPIKNQQ